MDQLLTRHVHHGDCELLPVPPVLSPLDSRHDSLELVEPFFGLVTHVMLSNFMPVLLWNFAFDAALFDLFKPSFERHILLAVSEETWGIGPGLVNGFEVERFDFEYAEHRHGERDVLRKKC
jgi:hypothetical protein